MIGAALALAGLFCGGSASSSQLPSHTLARPLAETAGQDTDSIICNPLPIAYRFQLALPSRREAADPTMFVYNSTYWLFTSKNGGYFTSKNLSGPWELVEPTGLPIEDYAPTVMAGGDGDPQVYYTAAGSKAVFATDDLLRGAWHKVAALAGYGDPCLFRDDDGAVYMAAGEGSTTAVARLNATASGGAGASWPELASADAAHCNYSAHGWEERGDANAGDPWEPGKLSPSVEGSWMTKGPGGRYYLQFAAPGTQYKTYGDGVFVADHVLGPYTRAPYSPFSFKPTGFAAGAGHSSTFQDLRGDWWHISTATISMRHRFERRLSLFPAWFDAADGSLRVDTAFGDYPLFTASARASSPQHAARPQWQLLSLRKAASASSTLQGGPIDPAPRTPCALDATGPCCGPCDASLAVDEDIRTWWSAATRKAGEWLAIDLGGGVYDVRAIQLNVADQGSTALGRLPQNASGAYQFVVEYSLDASAWSTVPGFDRRANDKDMPHDFVALSTPVSARHVRVTSSAVPAGALFSVSDFRVFGIPPHGTPKPAAVAAPTVTRHGADARHALIAWAAASHAQFYIVRYGIVIVGAGSKTPPELTFNYHVHSGTSLQLNALSVDQKYTFRVDAVNEAGVADGTGTARC
jgi:hypothetical protein